MEISGYALVRSDHPSNTKRGGVCLYYKNNLALRVVNIGYLNECLTLELKVGKKMCNFVVLYRSQSKSQDEFETFSNNFEMILDIFLNLLDPNQTVFLKGIRLITRLQLELSHLRKHKLKYNFQNCLNPHCSCGSSIESASHFLLHCPIFHDKRHWYANHIHMQIFNPFRFSRGLFHLSVFSF